MLDQLLNIDKTVFLSMNGSESLVLDNFALTEISHFAWIPFILAVIFLIIKTNNLKKSLIIFTLLGILYFVCDFFVSFFLQSYFARLRPVHDLYFSDKVDTVNSLTGGIHGFFSNQGSGLMGICLYLSLQVRSTKFFLTLLCWTLLHSWVTIYLGFYYPSDVLVGFMWGAVFGFLTYFTYYKIVKIFFEFHFHESLQCTKTGYFYVDVNFVIFVFLMNIIGILIISLFKF